jgi:hypothetical protein
MDFPIFLFFPGLSKSRGGGCEVQFESPAEKPPAQKPGGLYKSHGKFLRFS